jgi:hypothetical protein
VPVLAGAESPAAESVPQTDPLQRHTQRIILERVQLMFSGILGPAEMARTIATGMSLESFLGAVFDDDIIMALLQRNGNGESSRSSRSVAPLTLTAAASALGFRERGRRMNQSPGHLRSSLLISRARRKFSTRRNL